jgi:hypothetical protein
VNTHKMCFDFLYKFCVPHLSFQDEIGGDNVHVHRSSRKVPDVGT